MISFEVPSYYEAHLEEKIKKIKSDIKDVGKDGFSFAFITDIHWENNAKSSPALLKKLFDEVDIPYLLVGGDTVYGHNSKTEEELTSELQEFYSDFKPFVEKMIVTAGNHEAGYGEGYKFNLTNAKLYEHFFAPVSSNALYYFKDDEEKKVRYISLNTRIRATDEVNEKGEAIYNSTFLAGIMEEEFLWLFSDALSLPSSEWVAVLLLHEGAGESFINKAALIQALLAFNKKERVTILEKREDKPFYDLDLSFDFNNKEGEVILWLSGHNHLDLDEKEGGVLLISSVGDTLYDNRKASACHEVGTIHENSFDVFVINKRERSVKVTKIGLGSDREFLY